MIGLTSEASPLEPQEERPAHKLPLTSIEVPLGKEISVPGLIINFAPAAIVRSPVNSCEPLQVSVPVIAPLVVSFSADTVDAFRSGVEKTQTKVDKLKRELADAEAAAGAATSNSEGKLPNAESNESSANDDPVAAIIQRAKAKQAGTLEESPIDAAKHEVSSLEKRVIKTEQKLNTAKDERNDELVDVLASSLEKMQAKLATAKSKLAALES